MLKLYCSEMKKVWKKPIHKICIFLFLAFSIVLSVSAYQRYFNQAGLSNASITRDGQTYHGFAAIQLIDATHHELAVAADVMDMAWYEQMQKDMDQKLQTSSIKEIDDQQMQKVYGKHWQKLYEACQKQTLTYKDFPYKGDNQQHAPDELVPIETFPIYYTQESQEAQDSLQKLYLPSISNVLLEKETYLLSRDKIEEALRRNQEDPLAWTSDTYPKTMLQHIQRSYNDAEIAFINERFLQAETIFDAKQGYVYFLSSVESLQTYFPMGLLLLMILLCGMFNQEYSAKTDQILHAVEVGRGKQAIAKIAAGMTFVLILYVLGLICILGIPKWMVGFTSLEQIEAGMPITLLEHMTTFTLLFGVSCFSYGAVFLCISSYTQNRFISFILSGIWMLLSSYLGFLAGDVLYCFLPGSFLFPPFDQEILSLLGSIMYRSHVVALVWILISCVFLYLGYRHYQQREITNA